MRPNYRHSVSHHRDRWMVSYVDILTILLIFFIVGAAKSLDRPTPQPVPPPPAEKEPSRPDLIRAQELLKAQGLEPKLEPRGLVISIPQVILFSSGGDDVNPLALPAISQIADVLRDIPNDVSVIGYADTVPIHNKRFANNWDLSMARSHKILEVLSTRFGIPDSRLSVVSYGPYRPAAPNDTPDGRASNRRVEIIILSQ